MLLSVNKILMLIAILAAVWYGFKLVKRLDKSRKGKSRRFGFSGMRSGAKEEPEIVDLVRGADGKTFTARKTDEHS